MRDPESTFSEQRACFQTVTQNADCVWEWAGHVSCQEEGVWLFGRHSETLVWIQVAAFLALPLFWSLVVGVYRSQCLIKKWA